MSTYLCRDSSPYPAIGASHPTRVHLQMLMDLLFGDYGEFTMLNDLLCGEVLLSRGHTTLCEIYEAIALVDLRHFRILGALLTQCGGSLKYRTVHGARTDWWSGRVVHYPSTASESISHIVAQKKTAIAKYNIAIEHCTDDGITKILKRIRADEICHFDVLSSFAEGFSQQNAKKHRNS